MEGRRLPDTIFGTLPEGDIKPGDYWKYLDRQDWSKPKDCGEEYAATGNLTRTVWGYSAPVDEADPHFVGHVGTLMAHTVREHEDGTISVRPGDGSSNSILHKRGDDVVWHGYIDHGVWEAC